MKPSLRAALGIAAISLIGYAAVAGTPTPAPTPSARLGIELDVKPAEGKAGQFVVTSTVTDLESNAVIAAPRLMIASDKPARIETGVDGKWKLEISVSADGASRKGTYDATFTREGQVVSRQRLAMNLNG